MTRCSCNAHGTFLTAKGLAEAAQRENDQAYLDGMAWSRYLDRVGSVSDSGPVELHWPPDAQLEEQHRRFHNGS